MHFDSHMQNEAQRIEELIRYHILDTEEEDCFNQISRMASRIFSVEIAIISFTDQDRQWVKSQVGVDIKSVPRNLAICALTLLCIDHLQIPDLSLDERTADHPFHLEKNIRFYAGVPITSSRGFRLGCLCIMDTHPRTLRGDEIELLQALSDQVSGLLELRKRGMELANTHQRLLQSLEKSSICSWKVWLKENKVEYRSGWNKLLGLDHSVENFADWKMRIHPDDRDMVSKEFSDHLENKNPNFENVHRLRRVDGTWIWVLSKGWVEQKSSSGEPLLVVGTTIDITEQKVIEKELIENQQKTHAIFEGSHDAIMLTREDGTFQDCNTKTLEMFSIDSKEDFLNLRPSDLSPERQPDGQLSSVKSMAAISKAFSKGLYQFEWTHHDKYGMEFQAEVMLSVFMHKEKKLLHATIRNITERKQLESLTNNLQKIALIGAWDWEVESSRARCTKQINIICGLDSEEEGIFNFSDGIKFYANHEHPRITKCMLDCAQLGTPFDEVFELYDVKKNHKWVRVIGEPEFSARGQILKVKGTLQDVTEMKSMQIVTQNQNEELIRLESAINQSMSVIKMDTVGKITYANENFCEKMQFRPEELIGKMNPILGSENDDIKEIITDTILRGLQWKGKIKSRKKDGTPFWIDSNVVPLFTNKEFKEIICFGVDVTNEKKSQILFSAISSLSEKYIEASGTISDFYQHALKLLLELTESEFGFVGENLKDVKGEGFIKIRAATDISWNEESRLKFQDGIEFNDYETIYGQVIKSGTPIILNNPEASKLPAGHPPLKTLMGIPIFHFGKLIGLCFVANKPAGYKHEDVKYLVPFYDILGEIIHSIKLKEELQIQTRLSFHNAKLATIGELAAGVGHEINNPLVIIQGFRKILSMELSNLGLDEKFQTYCSNIDLATDRIANIVKGLRAFSRSDTDELSIFNLNELVSETTSMLQQIYQKSEIFLNFDSNEVDSMMYGNRGRIQQVLMNLISNARDATVGRKRSEIKINLMRLNGLLKVSVEDNGLGVPENIRERIFEPFFTTKEVNKGTGIGLSLSSTIIGEHQGSMEYKKLTQGSCFSFSVPALNDQNEPRHSEFKNVEKIAGNILVVDDEEKIRQIMVFFLKLSGANVLACSNGQEAMEELKRYEYDLIISDAQMPIVSGQELLKNIRGQTSLKQPKFILMSGQKIAEEKDLKTNWYCNGFLPKPFYPAQLCRFVSQIMKTNEGA